MGGGAQSGRRARRQWAGTWALGAALGAGLWPSSGRGAETGELVIFAAASLCDVFQKLARTFEKSHRGHQVRLSCAGSQELRVQIEQGARADVFASADERHMRALYGQGLVVGCRIFARNRPVLIVPIDNPARLGSFADLAKAQRVVVGAAEVPIGTYADQLLTAAKQVYGEAFGERVFAHIRSREPSARQVLAKVALGEADAGIVYFTDAQAAQDRVKAIAIPDDVNVTANAPIAVLAAAAHPALASRWLTLVFSEEGQRGLAAAGFVAPASGTATAWCNR